MISHYLIWYANEILRERQQSPIDKIFLTSRQADKDVARAPRLVRSNRAPCRP